MQRPIGQGPESQLQFLGLSTEGHESSSELGELKEMLIAKLSKPEFIGSVKPLKDQIAQAKATLADRLGQTVLEDSARKIFPNSPTLLQLAEFLVSQSEDFLTIEQVLTTLEEVIKQIKNPPQE